MNLSPCWFDDRCGLLAAGTTAGSITVFKYTPPSKEGDPVLDLAKCWEAQPAVQVGGEEELGRHIDWESGGGSGAQRGSLPGRN